MSLQKYSTGTITDFANGAHTELRRRFEGWDQFSETVFMVQYFPNQGTLFSPCLADVKWRLASICIALWGMARQDEPGPIVEAGSDVWFPAQISLHDAKCIDMLFCFGKAFGVSLHKPCV